MVGRNKAIYDLWVIIQDLVGPAHLWPSNLRRLFWAQDMGYLGRFKVAIFGYINGLNPLITYEWLSLMGGILPNDRKGWAHIKGLVEVLEGGVRYRDRYWSFNHFGTSTSLRRTAGHNDHNGKDLIEIFRIPQTRVI